MATEPPIGGRARNRRARIAAATLFLGNGALFANLLPRYPEIKADLAMSNAAFGAAVAAFSAGALLAGMAAGALIRRFGSARVAVATTMTLAAFIVLAGGLAATPLMFAAALLLAGASDAVTDVAQNANGLRLQRLYRRSIINSLHAVWAVGAIIGGLMGAAAIALDIPRAWHLGIAAVVFCALVAVAYPSMLPGTDHDDRPPPERTPRPASSGVHLVLLALVGIAVAGAVVEDAGTSWATLYLRDSLGAPGSLAALGYVALVGFMFVGRLVGDRLVDRFGERTVTRAGGLLAASGMGAALAFPSVPGTIAGFAAAGLGVATVVPAAMRAADELPGLRAGSGLTVLTWLMRVGSLGAPLIVGVVADATSLRVGLLSVPVAGIALIVLAQVLGGRRRSGRASEMPPAEGR
ncbi:MAG: MFS transporter [Actinomycetota bacterium]|nr:MFS transporter [Actinomycetota bacterium]